MTTKADNVIRLGDPESDPVAEMAKRCDIANVPDFLLYLVASEPNEKGSQESRLIYHAAKRELASRERWRQGKTTLEDLSSQLSQEKFKVPEPATFLHGGIDEDGCPYLQPMDEED